MYLFALGLVPDAGLQRSILVFVILHLLVYPSSNGYNSYMDRDEGSIGGIRNPLQPTRQLFRVSVLMDVAAVLLSGLISVVMALCIVLYILASRAYSYRGIRLKQYPVIGYLTVVLFQGGLTFFMVYHGCSVSGSLHAPVTGMLAASLLIGGFYPLTQIYQHEADRKDGVCTLSAWLGYRGTFIFTALVYSLAMALLAYLYSSRQQSGKFFVLATAMAPILVYFVWWASRVWRNENVADFTHTMRMNLLASVCTNIGFFILLIWK